MAYKFRTQNKNALGENLNPQLHKLKLLYVICPPLVTQLFHEPNTKCMVFYCYYTT